MIKTGESIYYPWVNIDDENAKVEIWEYVCTSIRKRVAYFTRKDSTTWVKVSKTHGDYGWSKRIQSYDRRSFEMIKDSKNLLDRDQHNIDKYFKSISAAEIHALTYTKACARRIKALQTRLEKKLKKK